MKIEPNEHQNQINWTIPLIEQNDSSSNQWKGHFLWLKTVSNFFEKKMSSHSGTIGRSSGRSISGNGTHMRRQRSVEWQHAHGYSSSDDDERGIHGTINPSFDSQLLAQLIAQSQELSNKCKVTARFHRRFYFLFFIP